MKTQSTKTLGLWFVLSLFFLVNLIVVSCDEPEPKTYPEFNFRGDVISYFTDDDLYAMELESGSKQFITKDYYKPFHRWSPGGEYIALENFNSKDSYGFYVSILFPTGEEVTRLMGAACPLWFNTSDSLLHSFGYPNFDIDGMGIQNIDYSESENSIGYSLPWYRSAIDLAPTENKVITWTNVIDNDTIPDDIFSQLYMILLLKKKVC